MMVDLILNVFLSFPLFYCKFNSFILVKKRKGKRNSLISVGIKSNWTLN
jgi:hypothetical protein